MGGFLGWEIEDEKTIRARLGGGGLKLFPTESEDGVVVGEKNERDLTFFLA